MVATWLGTRSHSNEARSGSGAAEPTHSGGGSTSPRRPTISSPGKGVTARLARLGLPLYCGGHRGHAVALTFDDGPGPYTHLVLRLLRRDHARATFFLVGRLLRDRPVLPLRERALGSLGDHTWSHVNLAALPTAAVTSQLEDTRRAISADAHVRVQIFRPPYGSRNATVDRVARRLGMLHVLWNVDSFDWAGANWTQIARNVLRHLSPGAIVLMHENRGQTIRALKFILLPALRRLRYRLVTVPQLLALDPPSTAQLDRGLEGCSRNSPSPGSTRTRSTASGIENRDYSRLTFRAER